ncbi:hypothetical protein EBT31_20000 [bacterium]|jgi:hypothetical protein|nr:hypothetical protein [bacterium]
MDNYRMSTLTIIGAIAVFIAAWFPPAQFLDFTADDMHKAYIACSLMMAGFAIYLRAVHKD